jgi:dCTP deaminase
MAFWSSQRIETENATRPLINPFDKECIRHGAYNLTLSRQVLTTPDGGTDSLPPGRGPTLKIPPGQFAILFTKESVHMPDNVIGFISIGTQEKWKGLINISGFHVTPGFSGCLKFTVYNAGNKPIHLGYGAEYFHLWFADLDQPTRDPYKGPANGQHEITPADREQMSECRHSTDTLHERLKSMEEQVKTIQAVGLLVLIPLLMSLGIAIFDHWFGQKNNLAIKGELFDVGALIIIGLLLVGFAGSISYWLLNHLIRWFKK